MIHCYPLLITDGSISPSDLHGTTNSSVAPQDLADALAKEELGTACGLLWKMGTLGIPKKWMDYLMDLRYMCYNMV